MTGGGGMLSHNEKIITVSQSKGVMTVREEEKDSLSGNPGK